MPKPGQKSACACRNPCQVRVHRKVRKKGNGLAMCPAVNGLEVILYSNPLGSLASEINGCVFSSWPCPASLDMQGPRSKQSKK